MNGTMFNYYFNCKRQLWLSTNKLNLEQNSEDALIGKEIHKLLDNGKNTEIELDSIKIDKMTDDYVIEVKKSVSNLEGTIMQLKYYLYVLDNYDIHKVGKIRIIEKDSTYKTIKIEYDNSVKVEVEDIKKEIEKIINSDKIPNVKNNSSCKKCAYYEYCYI